MRLVPVDRAGQLAAQDQATVHILSGHAVTGQVDHLAGVDVAPRAQRCRGVEQCHRLADAPGAGQDRELVRHRPGLDIIEDTGPESQVMRGPPLQDRVVCGPRGGVLPAGNGPPPRVRVRETVAALIISHAPTLPVT